MTAHRAPVADRAQSETQLLFAIRDALLHTGRCLLWRHNSGRLADARGRWVQYGLGVGGPDLIGILRPTGRLLGVEVKLPGKHPEIAQASWHRAAREAGALIIVAHSVEEALAGLPGQQACMWCREAYASRPGPECKTPELHP
jgi:hypothetical protein